MSGNMHVGIIPIPKKGDNKNCENCRGISVSNSIGRLYECIIMARVNDLWSDVEEQSGFRGGRSCTDNVFSLRPLIYAEQTIFKV